MAARQACLARAALDLLARDPEFAEPVAIMTRQAASGASVSNQRYLDASSILLPAAVLPVLQTRIQFKRNPTGKWSLDVDKKASGDGAIKLVVERLLPLLPK